MTWRRHAGDSKWHTGAPNDTGSFVTLCDGRWPLSSEAAGLIEHHEDPPVADRCGPCARRHLEIERTEVHLLADNLLALEGIAEPSDTLSLAQGIRIAREVRRLREDLEGRAAELHVVERELADCQELVKAIVSAPETIDSDRPSLTTALIEALSIAQAAGRRGLLSTREHERLRELARVVPQ